MRRTGKRRLSRGLPVNFPNLRRETGGIAPGKIGGHKKPVLSGANADWLRKRIRLGPFTLRKLTTEPAARGIKTDARAVWTFVHAEGMSFKKTIKPAEQDRPDVARKRIAGRPTKAELTLRAWSLSMRRGSKPTWRRCTAGDQAGSVS